MRKGLGIFDASRSGFASGQLTSRLEGNARALVVRGVVDATLSLGPIFSIAGLGQVQWTNDPLLNYEEFALGSLTIGRGYDPGSNSGDRAAGGHVELRADLPLTSALGTQFYGFFDHLYLENLDRTRIEGRAVSRALAAACACPSPIAWSWTSVTPNRSIVRCCSTSSGRPRVCWFR